MSEPAPPIETATADASAAIPFGWALAVGAGAAAVLAVAVAGQTYLSMLGHGHSFGRILAWQLGSWSYWAVAAPLVLRRGAQLAARERRTWRDAVHLLALGALLIAVHSVFTSQLTIWVQPFVPVVTYDFAQAFVAQIPSRFVIDPVVFVLLLAGGGVLSAHFRARQLEIRESRLAAELARAQLHALRLEIEPHFLFNTLNAISALIRLKDNGRALDMLVELSDFMRTNLDRPREPFAPLSSEIEWIKRYVSLQQTRFDERLEVDYAIDEDCSDIAVPTLLLQPIVENALRHGAARQAQRCHVAIGAALDGPRLKLWVVDDGVGLPTNFDVDRAAGTGLRNTRSRLDQVYGTAATFEIRGGERTGTTVVISVPVDAARWKGRATA